MPVTRPTANSIWRSFQTSGKKHLVLTGASGSGKTTLLASLFSSPMPGVTSWVVPEKGVYLKNNCSKEIIQIGRYHSDPTHKRNQMLAIPECFDEKGNRISDIDAVGLDNCIQSYKNIALHITKLSPYISSLEHQRDRLLNQC